MYPVLPGLTVFFPCLYAPLWHVCDERRPCLCCVALQAEVYDDDQDSTDDLIGSVKFGVKDIGLEDDEVPLECWMVLGNKSEQMLHQSRELLTWLVLHPL